MKILAFGHKKGTGKTTATKFMLTHLRCQYPGLKVAEVSFAAKLKDIAYQLYRHAGLKPGIFYEAHRDVKEVKLKELNLSPRDLWLGVGNAVREVYLNTWIDYALKGVEADVLIISDLRFKNESQAIREAGGFLVKLNRNAPRGGDPAEVDLDDWDDWDVIINNNNSLQELNTEIETLVRILL